ncbi:efflux RND transporter periplasmic adaptor subunit [Roseibium sediminicola]|uniref:Efflux RND transporter periplasmic adaptor subunit n=1 Tax=Roseibium sediminicola TaxID=2933272 RepID=A0ABT0GYH2_9HYPH|nr:efflux RND transporter periplasmic adaptor subunit [Roseibium sp. CAU 1639]MCK7614112.1 efflux RND transporter periplasmic adaptor subunit [Roseibium sp. CAU 1639]
MRDKVDEADGQGSGSGRLKRLARGLLSLTTFSVNSALAVAAVMLGVTTIQMRAEEKPQISAAPLIEVAAFRPDFQAGYDVARRFTGRLEPARQTDLAFELTGTIREIMADEGGTVGAGDIIARLDTRSLEAERRRQQANRSAAESDLELAQLTLDRRRKLQKAGHVSDEVLDQARLALSRLNASLAQIDAAIEAIDINLDKSVLRSPFGGRVGARLLDEGATATPGQPVLSVLESARPTVRIGLAPDVVKSLDPDGTFTIEIGGQPFKARFAGLRPDLQTRTRTIEALFELEAPPALPGFGQLAELSVEEHVASPGYWVPAASLKEGPRGLWTLLTLVDAPDDGTHLVVREAVEVLHMNADRAFVRGTITRDTQIVAEGVHRVVAGQPVRLQGSGA